MSIAALSSSFVAAVRERAVPSAPPVNADVAPPAREHGRRAALIDAMRELGGDDLPAGPGGDQAVFRFAQALMHDLRRIDGAGANGPGRGHAWGRRDWSDLPQRIDALATASNAPTAAASPAESPAPIEPVVAASADAGALQADLPPQPNPVTTTSAALHLMQVPTSRLLEAFAALREALGQSTGVADAGDGRAALAEFLTRLSSSLAADTTAALPAGSVVDLRA